MLPNGKVALRYPVLFAKIAQNDENSASIVLFISNTPSLTRTSTECVNQVNDVIVMVDGRSLAGLDLEEIKHLTVGDEGSVVQISLRRDGQDKLVMLQRIQGELALLGDSRTPQVCESIFCGTAGCMRQCKRGGMIHRDFNAEFEIQ